jgi:hypothetical protein
MNSVLKESDERREKDDLNMVTDGGKNEEYSSNEIPVISADKEIDTKDSAEDKPETFSGFSPQNLAAKLLSSLNNKDEQREETNNMLIFDDLNELKNAEESKIETGAETLNKDEKDTKISNKDETSVNDHDHSVEIQKEQIVESLMDNLLNEIKTSLFPVRIDYPDFFDFTDPRNIIPGNRKLVFESANGIETDFASIDNYLKDVIDEIMKNESIFINNILTPIQRDSMEMLRLLQSSDIGSYGHFDTYDHIAPRFCSREGYDVKN